MAGTFVILPDLKIVFQNFHNGIQDFAIEVKNIALNYLITKKAKGLLNDYKKYRTLQVTNYKKKKSMILLRKQKRKRVLLCVG